MQNLHAAPAPVSARSHVRACPPISDNSAPPFPSAPLPPPPLGPDVQSDGPLVRGWRVKD
eukprot:3978736-Pyramimonas_sp.AAC.1